MSDDDGLDEVDTVILQLQSQVADQDRTIRELRGQVDSLRALLHQMEGDMLMAPLLVAPLSVTPMTKPPFPDCPLLVAAEAGDAAMVAILIDNGADPRKFNDAALLLACQGGHLAVVEELLLLQAGVDVDVDHGSPLLWAVRLRNAELASLLLRHGADANVMGGAPIRNATRLGDLQMVALLLAHGSSPDAGITSA
jgi:hypothetical protein